VAEGKRKSRIPKKYKPVVLFLRDAGIALAFVVCVLLAMFFYTGLWPPLVVIESNSMMHTEDNTRKIGVIDTGDLVLVKKVNSVPDIQTYVQGFVSGHRTYGDYGDVVIYKPLGQSDYTPIIHRAMLYLVANGDGVSYSAPALRQFPSARWTTQNSADTWDHLTSTLTLYHVGYRDMPVSISIDSIILRSSGAGLASGYITKGDHNTGIDQAIGEFGAQPVHFDWIVGVAHGEIPWFGLLKLSFTNTMVTDPPPNSTRNLWICIAIIVITPIAADVFLTHRERVKAAKAIVEDEDEAPPMKKVPDEPEENSEPPKG
jgi:signal peptidase